MSGKYSVILIVLALLIMLFPVYGLLFPQTEDMSINENRELAEWPREKDIKKQLSGIENYVNDHLAFRSSMISSVLHMDLALGESPDSQVILGQNRWLFYNEWDSDKDIRREITVGPDEMDLLVSTQRDVRDRLAGSGADYRILVAPDKHTIYPEFLPISCRQGEGPSRMDQILAALHANQIPVFDVRPALWNAKTTETEPLYYLDDTHWNMTGAYHAYQAVMQELLPDYPELHQVTEKEFIRDPARFSGDLSGMVGLAGTYPDTYSTFSFPESQVKRNKKLSFSTVSAYKNKKCPQAPSILLYSDSFGAALKPFLMESASVLYVCDSESIVPEVIEKAKPDIVIREIVERNITWLETGLSDEGIDEAGEI